MAYSIDDIANAAEALNVIETEALITLLVNQNQDKRKDEALNEEAKRATITQARMDIANLVGNPDGTAPDESTIHGMMRHEDAVLHEHAGRAIRLLLEGLLINVNITDDIASVVGT